MADPLQRSQQQQTDQDLWKFSAVSAVAATANLVDNEPNRSSRENAERQRSRVRSRVERHSNHRDVKSGNESTIGRSCKSGSNSMVGRLQVCKRVDDIWNESAIGRLELDTA